MISKTTEDTDYFEKVMGSKVKVRYLVNTIAPGPRNVACSTIKLYTSISSSLGYELKILKGN